MLPLCVRLPSVSHRCAAFTNVSSSTLLCPCAVRKGIVSTFMRNACTWQSKQLSWRCGTCSCEWSAILRHCVWWRFGGRLHVHTQQKKPDESSAPPAQIVFHIIISKRLMRRSCVLVRALLVSVALIRVGGVSAATKFIQETLESHQNAW